jgi:seryl-tRNA synthetase
MTDPNVIQQTATTAIQAASDSGIITSPNWVGLVTAVPFVGWWLYRQFTRLRSKDGLELVKDRAETDVVKTLQEENAKLRSEGDKLIVRLDKVSEERNNAIQQLGKFSAEAEMNRTKIGELQTSVTNMTIKLEEQTKLLQEVLLENANLKSELRNMGQLNSRLEIDLTELKQAIARLESR